MLQMYLVERKITNKRYTKFFLSLISATVLISLVTYRKNTGWKLDHLKFRIHLVESLLLYYSFQHTTLGHHGTDTTTQRLRECHFPRGIPPTEKMSKTSWQSEVSSRHDKRREWILLTGLWCCCVQLCVCIFQGLPWKHYWGKVTCIFTIYGLQEITVPSFIQIGQ